MSDDVYATRPLVMVLLEFARDAEPSEVSIALTATPAGELIAKDLPGVDLDDLDDDTPVFTDFYFPDAGGAVNRVFGMDLGTPAGQSSGRFVSHPSGNPEIGKEDDLGPRVLVAVPPWDLDDVRAYDRNGNRHPLRLVAAETEAEEEDALFE